MVRRCRVALGSIGALAHKSDQELACNLCVLLAAACVCAIPNCISFSSCARRATAARSCNASHIFKRVHLFEHARTQPSTHTPLRPHANPPAKWTTTRAWRGCPPSSRDACLVAPAGGAPRPLRSLEVLQATPSPYTPPPPRAPPPVVAHAPPPAGGAGGAASFPPSRGRLGGTAAPTPTARGRGTTAARGSGRT